MDSDWSLDFCLACDKQTSEGVYCSQACRAADLHNAESHSSHTTTSSSPQTSTANFTWDNFWLPGTSPSTTSLPAYAQPSSHHRHSTASTREDSPKSKGVWRHVSTLSLDGLFFEGPAAGVQTYTTTSSAASSTASSPTTEKQAFLSDHVRQALKTYENLFDQNRRRKRSSASLASATSSSS